MKFLLLAASALVAAVPAVPAGAVETPITINLRNTGGVEYGTQAYYGFKTAAKFWESYLTTSQPTTLNIDVGFRALGPGILGSTGSTFTSKLAVNIENRIKARQSGAFDALASANLPGLSAGDFGAGTALSMETPGYTGYFADGTGYGIDNATKVYDTDGGYNNSVIGLTTANAKALGYTASQIYDPVRNPTGRDASITFSSDFGFDFDPTNGVDTGKYDFLGVAIHEIGHALGFVSGVDDYDFFGTGGPVANEVCFSDGTLCKDYPANDDWFGETLDLYRYSGKGVLDWTTGTASYFSVDGGATAYGNGLFSTGAYNGDGNQASHWKAPVVAPFCTGFLGIMNPYLCSATADSVTALDLAAFDAIGWNTKIDVLHNPGFVIGTGSVSSFVPEPATWGMLIVGFGAIGAMQRRRRIGYLTA